MERAWAAAAYVPVPGWQIVAVLASPRSRLIRFHVWQALTWSILLWAPIFLMALLLSVLAGRGEQALGLATGLWLLVGIVGALRGAVAAGRGRFVRMAPAAQLLGALGK